MSNFIAGWFVIYSKPRHEKKIAEQLGNMNVENFLPIVKSLRTWSDRRKYVDAPLFPSYIFVRLEDVQSYFSSLEVNGVLHYVRTGKQIATVEETIINNLKLLTCHSQKDIEVSSEYIKPGRNLFVKEGPFTGFSCEIIDYKGKQKILVRIELLQRNILVDMPVEYLMPALAT